MTGPVASKTKKEKSNGWIQGQAPQFACRSVSFDVYAGIMELQQLAGNQAVSRLLQSGKNFVPSLLRDYLHSPGQPLDPVTLAGMEERFGKDLSQVRVHTGAAAARTARALDARAYTGGAHIVFDEGQYAPRSPAGRELLAHEIAHVVAPQTSVPRVQLASRKKASPPLDLDNPAVRGQVFEPMYVDQVKSYYESKGYQVYTNKEWQGWLLGTFKTGVQSTRPKAGWGPELVAIHDVLNEVVVVDITATAGSSAAVKPGDLRKLPEGAGEVETKHHLEKTIDYARQISRQLPDDMKHYTVIAQDWYREDPRSEKSVRVVVKRAGEPVIEAHATEQPTAKPGAGSRQEVRAVPASGGREEARRSEKRPPAPIVPLSTDNLIKIFVRQYRLPAPGGEFFQAYKNYGDYETAYWRWFPGDTQPTPYGWFDTETKLIHFPPDADLRTKVHEMLHWYGTRHYVDLYLGSFVNEGITEWLMRQRLGEKMGEPYDEHVRFVRDLAAKIGEKPIMWAFLHGRWDLFHRAMTKQAGDGLKAQQAYALLAEISADGKGIEYMHRVYALLNLGQAPFPRRPPAEAGEFQLQKQPQKQSFDPYLGERAIEWNTKTGKTGKTEVYTDLYTGQQEKMKPPGRLRSPAGKVAAGGAVGTASLLMAVEEQLSLLAKIREHRLAGSLRTLQWWLQRGVRPPARGVTDRYFQKDEYTAGYDAIAAGLRENKFNGIVIDRLEDAQEYQVFAAWVQANIQTWDDFYQHFVLNWDAGVRWHDGKWELTTWKWGDMPPANVYPEYVTDDRINAIMEPVRSRLLAGTEAELKARAPQSKKIIHRSKVITFFSPDMKHKYFRILDFKPVFYQVETALPVPAGYVLVSGADLQTYTLIHGTRAYYERSSPAKITAPGSEWNLVAEDKPFTGWANINIPVCLVEKDMLVEAPGN